ncbi:MAG: hypothetical protein HOI80_04160 [Alphaproteobacteria bacterium]|nr:hypothetical protein [Alphaproteobacteria bacterium]MBT5390715.1 hypothetical protein [Alphaproteobacteria bacterium]MBT5541084.1 hypothetical protein [Alphaproteobacteria bacterium]MBT5654679.1 hypothetical protein [Alphaproteobacteria bacterium]
MRIFNSFMKDKAASGSKKLSKIKFLSCIVGISLIATQAFCGNGDSENEDLSGKGISFVHPSDSKDGNNGESSSPKYRGLQDLPEEVMGEILAHANDDGTLVQFSRASKSCLRGYDYASDSPTYRERMTKGLRQRQNILLPEGGGDSRYSISLGDNKFFVVQDTCLSLVDLKESRVVKTFEALYAKDAYWFNRDKNILYISAHLRNIQKGIPSSGGLYAFDLENLTQLPNLISPFSEPHEIIGHTDGKFFARKSESGEVSCLSDSLELLWKVDLGEPWKIRPQTFYTGHEPNGSRQLDFKQFHLSQDGSFFVAESYVSSNTFIYPS